MRAAVLLATVLLAVGVFCAQSNVSWNRHAVYRLQRNKRSPWEQSSDSDGVFDTIKVVVKKIKNALSKPKEEETESDLTRVWSRPVNKPKKPHHGRQFLGFKRQVRDADYEDALSDVSPKKKIPHSGRRIKHPHFSAGKSGAFAKKIKKLKRHKLKPRPNPYHNCGKTGCRPYTGGSNDEEDLADKIGGFRIKGFLRERHAHAAHLLSDQRPRGGDPALYIKPDFYFESDRIVPNNQNEDEQVKPTFGKKPVKRTRESPIRRPVKRPQIVRRPWTGGRAMNGLSLVRVSSRGAEQDDEPLADMRVNNGKKDRKVRSHRPTQKGRRRRIKNVSMREHNANHEDEQLSDRRRIIRKPKVEEPVMPSFEAPRVERVQRMEAPVKPERTAPGYVTGRYRAHAEALADRRPAKRVVQKKRGKAPPPPMHPRFADSNDEALSEFRQAPIAALGKPFIRKGHSQAMQKNRRNPFLDELDEEDSLSDKKSVRGKKYPVINFRNPWRNEVESDDKIKKNRYPSRAARNPFAETESDKKIKANMSQMKSKVAKDPFRESLEN